MKVKKAIALLFVLVFLFSFTAVGQAEDYSNLTLRIAYQYGMQYTPVYVMLQKGYLEELLPGVTVKWSNLAGGSAMNEALISGSLDVAFMGIPPALIAIDIGAPYRIACGICVPPAVLMVTPSSGITSIADIGNNDAIAVPSIGSIQNIMLAMACEKYLNDAHALDNNLIAMANPDAYAALISGSSVTGHFASMPYIDYEQNNGMVAILSAEDCMGSGASIVCVATETIHDNGPVYAAIKEALEMAITFINEQSDECVQIVADTEGISTDDAKAYLNWEGNLYTSDVYGLTTLGEFMGKNGYIRNAFMGFAHYTWDGAVEGSFVQ